LQSTRTDKPQELDLFQFHLKGKSMQFLIAAVLVVLGAGPACDWLLLSPYGQIFMDFRESVAIKAVLGQPDWLLTAAGLMACYGLAGVLLRAFGGLSSPPQYFSSSVSPFDKQAQQMKAQPADPRKSPPAISK
jgi:hypothetical protein